MGGFLKGLHAIIVPSAGGCGGAILASPSLAPSSRLPTLGAVHFLLLGAWAVTLPTYAATNCAVSPRQPNGQIW